MMQPNDLMPSRREFCRVDVYIPLEYRLIPQEEQIFVKSRVGEVLLPDFTIMPPQDDPLMEYMNHLNKKLDAILRMLALQYDGFDALPFKYVSISGNGMRFSSQRPFICGDMIEFKLILTITAPVAIYLYGKIVRLEKQTNGHFINTRFVATDDVIRNMVIRFIFEQERKMLREKSGEKE